MMLYPSLDKLMEKVDTRYTMVILTAKRARMLSEDGEIPVADCDTNKIVSQAVKEIADGKVKYRRQNF